MICRFFLPDHWDGPAKDEKRNQQKVQLCVIFGDFTGERLFEVSLFYVILSGRGTVCIHLHSFHQKDSFQEFFFGQCSPKNPFFAL